MKHYTNSKICPYCGGNTHIISAQEKLRLKMQSFPTDQYVLMCDNYPNCQAYSFFDPKQNLYPGIVADKFLRKMRVDTHRCIDILWLTGMLKRKEMYCLLSRKLHYNEKKYCHIRYFGINECVDTVLFAISYINDNFQNIKSYADLTNNQCQLLKRLIKNEFELSSKDFISVVLKEVIDFLQTPDNIKLLNISLKRNSCSIVRNHKIIVLNIKGKSPADYIKSVYNELHSVWKQNLK